LLEMVMVKCSSLHHYAVQCHCNAFSCKASRSPPPENTNPKTELCGESAKIAAISRSKLAVNSSKI
jgi:hypothetical protein